MIDQLLTSLHSNDFLNGGLVLLVIGTLLSQIPRLSRALLNLALRHLTVTMEIRNRYVIYWIDQYLQHSAYGDRCRALKCSRNMDDADAPVVLGPGPGRHLIRHDGAHILLDRFVDKGDGETDSLLPQEVITLRSFSRSRLPLLSFLAAVQSDHRQRRDADPRSLIHVNATSADWIPLRIGSPRPLNSVVLQLGLKEQLVGAVRTYLDSRPTYEALGVPYRLGISLEGPPGSGKSSLVKAVANEFNLPLYILDLRRPRISDFDITYLVSVLPLRCILLIEDVDCESLSRDTGSPASSESPAVTLKGLLNAIDGPNAAEGRILFLTTNHPENLDPALIRHGRIDHRYRLGPATTDQAVRLFQRFFPEANGQARRFGEGLMQGTSMAEVQHVLMQHRGDVEAASRWGREG